MMIRHSQLSWTIGIPLVKHHALSACLARVRKKQRAIDLGKMTVSRLCNKFAVVHSEKFSERNKYQVPECTRLMSDFFPETFCSTSHFRYTLEVDEDRHCLPGVTTARGKCAMMVFFHDCHAMRKTMCAICDKTLLLLVLDYLHISTVSCNDSFAKNDVVVLCTRRAYHGGVEALERWHPYNYPSIS